MTQPVTLKSLAPILVVNSVALCVPFWERLGFSLAVTVPEAEPYDFAIVAKDGLEVMLQSRQSVEQDTPGMAEGVAASILYLTVATLEPVLEAVGDAEIAVPRRQTFYGADEIFIYDPAANVIGFAAPAGGQEQA